MSELPKTVQDMSNPQAASFYRDVEALVRTHSVNGMSGNSFLSRDCIAALREKAKSYPDLVVDFTTDHLRQPLISIGLRSELVPSNGEKLAKAKHVMLIDGFGHEVKVDANLGLLKHFDPHTKQDYRIGQTQFEQAVKAVQKALKNDGQISEREEQTLQHLDKKLSTLRIVVESDHVTVASELTGAAVFAGLGGKPVAKIKR